MVNLSPGTDRNAMPAGQYGYRIAPVIPGITLSGSQVTNVVNFEVLDQCGDPSVLVSTSTGYDSHTYQLYEGRKEFSYTVSQFAKVTDTDCGPISIVDFTD